MMRVRLLLGPVLLASLVGVASSLPHASAAGDSGRYVGAGTAVVRQNGQPAADEGSVVCDNGNGAGAGGVCLKFGGGDAVHVVDDAVGENVAYQVCLDNNGDGLCTSPDNSFYCPDQIFFSHDDAGSFYNPVGPLPTGFAQNCPGGPWKGYVVFLCEGAHAVGTSVHSHEATTGTGTVTTGGEGLGTFCGGGPQPSRKRYTVGTGAHYVSGGTAVARNNGEPTVDDGSVVCNDGDNTGVGGFCTSFGDGDAMSVVDATAGQDVAFQVCIDNSADGVCTSPDTRSICPDQVFFSHDDAGNFYNPLGPIPTGFLPGCGARTPWQGYVVFLCEGTHVAGTSAHTHTATTGTGRVTNGGEGLGTFCGGSHSAPSNKRYKPDFSTPDRPPVQDLGLLGADGSCSARLLGDPSGELGGQDVVDGEVSLDIVARDDATGLPTPTASITDARCDLLVNGQNVGTVLTAPDGIGATSNAGRLEAVARPDDVLTLCASYQVNGVQRRECADVTSTQVPPQSVVDVIDNLVPTVDDTSKNVADPLGCPLLMALAPVVNGLGQPGLLRIDPGSGDTYVDGALFRDCAPYDLVP